MTATAFVVKYKIDGFDGERTSPMYSSEVEALTHADDIRGYEGVQYATVEPCARDAAADVNR